MHWGWAVDGVTDETPRTMGPECENYLTDRRRWTESVLLCTLFACVIKLLSKRLEPIQIPDPKELEKPHSPTRLLLLIIMTYIFGMEMGFKLANRSVIFILNPCHIQTLVQIYLLAAKPSRLTITLFRIQMNNLNGPFLAVVFPEVEGRLLPLEQATYWIQHAMLFIIPVYILRTGAYKVEDIKDFKWAIIGVETQLIYCFGVLSFVSIRSGINLTKMLCADESDPFQGDNYRIAAAIHETLLCPILNKLTVLIFSTPKSIQYSGTTMHHQQQYTNLPEAATVTATSHQTHQTGIQESACFLTDGVTTMQLIQRKSNLPETNKQHRYTPQHHDESKETVYKGEYLLESDDFDMEVIDPSRTSTTAMPTTKIN